MEYSGPLKATDQPVLSPSINDLLSCNDGEVTITTSGLQICTGPTWLGWIWVKSIQATGEVRIYDSVGASTGLKFIFDDSSSLKFFNVGSKYNNGIWADAVSLSGVFSFGFKEPWEYEKVTY